MINFRKIFTLQIVILMIFSANISAQHRGDNLSFQGLSTQNEYGVRVSSMGGAGVSLLGDLSAIFYNPAGLTGIKSLQVSVSANSSNFGWRENQDYRPNRLFATLPFYLEGLYIPDPADDGVFDHERLWTDDQQIDSSYVVTDPKLGLDPFSEEAADWKHDISNFSVSDISVAMPFELEGNNFVVGLGYHQSISIEDFDRNDTYLDPHIGYFGYGEIGKVNGVDTLDVNWYKFLREKSGSVNSINFALGYEVMKEINVGVGFKYFWGNSDDKQALDHFGKFSLIDENRFKFYHKNQLLQSSGSSDYSYMKMNIGALVNLEKITFGINIDLPYTITRDWSYSTTLTDSNGTVNSSTSGSDELSIPIGFSAGLTFLPVDNFSLSLAIENKQFADAEFSLANNDSTHRNWSNQLIFRVGTEYEAIPGLYLRAGYKLIPEVFIPDGAAIKDEGPTAKSYSFGAGYDLFMGTINVAYEIRELRYYDSYYSNTNYVTQTYENISFGYTIKF